MVFLGPATVMADAQGFPHPVQKFWFLGLWTLHGKNAKG